jgi:asparagine synthase (glutamine-hydrolysing)
MSGIACIYNFDGRPADQEMIRRMSAASAHRGPDGIRHWNDGPVALASLMFWTTPEALRETQPLSDESDALHLIMDGRVDNRAELQAALDSKGAVLRTDTDAELVLRAYQCWGEECPKHIIGDFAFAIWDKPNLSLFCARDILGIKPFYYFQDAGAFLCASELHQLFECPKMPKEPNEGMIGEYLQAMITNCEETLYRGIKRLPPAHCMRVQPGRIRRWRYWDVDPKKAIRYKRDEDYADHLRELFAEAVRCRLRSHGRIGSYLSGGLDSSSIVSMVQHLAREGKSQPNGFETFSMVFPGKACDERRYIDAVVNKWNLQANYYEPNGREASGCLEGVARYRDIPDYPNGLMSEQLRVLAREKGFRVILGGYGGDEWFDGGHFYCADLLRNWRLWALWKQIRSDVPDGGPREYLRVFVRRGLNPVLPNWARPILPGNRLPRYLNDDFARRINLADRMKSRIRKSRFPSLDQFAMYDLLLSGAAAHGYEIDDRGDARLQIEHRYPFNDRRIIEFAMALPDEQRKRQDHQQRFILRQAMFELLPASVGSRGDKADFSHVFPEALESLGGEAFFDSLAIAREGWVNAEEIRVKYRTMTQHYRIGDPEYIAQMWHLWMVFGIEAWFRTVFLNGRITSVPKEQLAPHCA